MNALRFGVRLGLVIGVIFAVSLPVAAQDAPKETYGGGSVQAYAADAPIATGTIVQLTGKDASRVKIAEQSHLQDMFGLVVDKSQLPLTITGGDSVQNETFVAATGTYNALVSTEAGPIASGDYVTLSAIKGVAMKAGTEEETVFGRANSAFDGRGVTLGTMAIKDRNGNITQTVTLGSIPVTIDIKRNPNEKTTESNLPDFLQRVGQEIAEKEVSPIRIYLSMGISLICIIAVIVMLYAGIRNAVIAIGRNPMSRKSVFRALLEVILTALLVLIVGLFAVYLLLKL